MTLNLLSITPPSRLKAIPSGDREAILASVTAFADLLDISAEWVEKVRRFASFHGRNLNQIAHARFGTGAEDQLQWMARLLVEGGKRHPERGTAPIDAACLSAALYCLDAIGNHNTALATLVEDAIAAIRTWVFTESQKPVRPALGQSFSYCPGLWREEARSAVKVVIFSPNPYSLYSLSVLEFCRRLDIPVDAVVLRRFTVGRFCSEWRRDGIKLLRKIWRKLVLKRDENQARVDASLNTLVNGLNISTRDVRRLAGGMGVPVRHVCEFEEITNELAAGEPKLGLFTGGGILKAPLINAFSHGVINVHMGHLPQYKGMDVVQAPILEGRSESIGVTAHFMTRDLDAGDILTKFTLDPAGYSTLGALRNTLTGIMPLVLVDAALGMMSGRLNGIPQPGGGRQYYFMHPKLLPVIEEHLTREHECTLTAVPSLVKQTIDVVLKDMDETQDETRI